MPANPNPDETDVLDLNAGLIELKRLADQDGVRTPKEVKVIDLFEGTIERLTFRVNARLALESVIRNGVSRYTRAKAEHAGFVILTTPAGQPHNVVAFPQPDPFTPEAA